MATQLGANKHLVCKGGVGFTQRMSVSEKHATALARHRSPPPVIQCVAVEEASTVISHRAANITVHTPPPPTLSRLLLCLGPANKSVARLTPSHELFKCCTRFFGGCLAICPTCDEITDMPRCIYTAYNR